MIYYRISALILFLTTFLHVYSQPTVKFYIEKSSFQDRFLTSLESDFRENFKVNCVMTIVDDIGNEANLIKSITDGTILSDNGIPKMNGVYYIFLTRKPLFFAESPSDELRGFSAYNQSIGIVSSHKIKDESSHLGLNFEFQFFKVVKHEYLHLLGLSHCFNYNRCMMVASFPPSNFHFSNDRLCNVCLSQLDSSLIKPKLIDIR